MLHAPTSFIYSLQTSSCSHTQCINGLSLSFLMSFNFIMKHPPSIHLPIYLEYNKKISFKFNILFLLTCHRNKKKLHAYPPTPNLTRKIPKVVYKRHFLRADVDIMLLDEAFFFLKAAMCDKPKLCIYNFF